MRVKIICGRPQRYCPWFEMHHASLGEYADRHGYVYEKDLDWSIYAALAGFVRTVPCTCPKSAEDTQPEVRECVLERILGNRKMVAEALDGCDLLLSLGPDTVVTNMTIRLEDVMPVGAHVLMMREEEYECDCVLARNTPQAKSFLSDWVDWMVNPSHPVWANYGHFVPPFCRLSCHAQDDFDTVNEIHKWHDDVVLTAVMERYPEQAARVHTLFRKGFAVKHVHWEKGDFIMHVPGSPDDHRTSYLRMGMENTVR